jgi:preprotein translocase subunit SecA
MLKKIIHKIGGDPNQKAIEKYSIRVDQINLLEPQFESLSDEQLKAKTVEFRERLAGGETLDELLTEAYAVVREASKRTLGMRHYDVQMIAGIILHEGQVAEMRTGEGKTLMATLPLYLNALEGKGAHLITVNDYLARRDARWMAPVYNFLGLSVGVLQMGSRTESGKKAFLVDLEKVGSQEDQHQLEMVDRNEAYLADITYGTNNEFGFDYLRDNMKMSLEARAQRGHHYAIIDEVDNVLIDEARTPLIISGPSYDDAENYNQMAQVVKRLNPEDYEINEKDRTATLTEIGETHVEQIMGIALRDPERPEDITPEQARTLGFLEQAMRAQYLFKRNKDYLVQAGQVIIIDEFTGRLMPGRRWSDGLHQAVEAKEGVKVQSENITHATITIQNYFRMYNKLAGMTGTAMTEAEEFSKIYELEVLAIPPNVDFIANQPDSPLVTLKARDPEENNFEFIYYALKEDPEQKMVFFQRRDYPDVVYRSKEAKLRAIVQEIVQYQVMGRPILVGTTSVEHSEQLSNRLKSGDVRKLMQVLLLRRVWMEKNNRVEDGRTIMALSFLNEPLDKIDISQMRQTARDLELSLNVESDKNIAKLLEILNLKPNHAERLKGTLGGGVNHNVLNARKHTEESQIIAQAGAFGAVTIATNMAGRGVDIKLGGEIAEEVLTSVSRVLRRNGVEDPYDLTLEAQLAEINKLSEEDCGIYTSEINFFKQSMDDMKMVKELGGLHVIGSERHEARRIDNQLRGRAARQGDPGSSRFYLSMEDDLMRLFGGQQMENMMQRLGMDDAMPLELNLVSRIIEGAQTRVEGANFDSRKHLLEYDDVLNSQRNSIYAQRDRIFVKDDLSDDVLEMLEAEVYRRVPLALMDPEGPWKLFSWMEQIQPTITFNGQVYPSFTYKYLLEEINTKPHSSPQEAMEIILPIIEAAVGAEEEHLLSSAGQALGMIADRLAEQFEERREMVETFFESLGYADETDTRGTKELLDELSMLARVPIRFSNSEQRLLRDDPEQAEDLALQQLENALTSQAITRMVGAVQRRLPEGLNLDAGELSKESWETIEDKILESVAETFEKRKSRYFGKDGLLAAQGLEMLETLDGEIDDLALIRVLMALKQEELTGFDKRTHRQIKVKLARFSYLYHTAQQLEAVKEEELTEAVRQHLIGAQQTTVEMWGQNAWKQVAPARLADLPEAAQKLLEIKVGREALDGKPLNSLSGGQKDAAITALGTYEVTAAYRSLLLRVISELWIEYLTKMEALRVSIGLEAYGQRDPLVMYKTKASEMFEQLLSDVRMSVVTRMFTYRPRLQTPEQVQETAPPQMRAKTQEELAEQAPKKKKRRRRRR